MSFLSEETQACEVHQKENGASIYCHGRQGIIKGLFMIPLNF